MPSPEVQVADLRWSRIYLDQIRIAGVFFKQKVKADDAGQIEAIDDARNRKIKLAMFDSAHNTSWAILVLLFENFKMKAGANAAFPAGNEAGCIFSWDELLSAHTATLSQQHRNNGPHITIDQGPFRRADCGRRRLEESEGTVCFLDGPHDSDAFTAGRTIRFQNERKRQIGADTRELVRISDHGCSRYSDGFFLRQLHDSSTSAENTEAFPWPERPLNEGANGPSQLPSATSLIVDFMNESNGIFVAGYNKVGKGRGDGIGNRQHRSKAVVGVGLVDAR